MFEVSSKCCNQCLFSENKIVSDRRKVSLLKEIIQEQSYFECHKATMAGKNTCCRGFYDKLGQHSQMIRIAERLGAIEFVEVGK
ncbi:hypothetical protein JCM16163A_41420 [Paenibacillus sp. YK5]